MDLIQVFFWVWFGFSNTSQIRFRFGFGSNLDFDYQTVCLWFKNTQFRSQTWKFKEICNNKSLMTWLRSGLSLSLSLKTNPLLFLHKNLQSSLLISDSGCSHRAMVGCSFCFVSVFQSVLLHVDFEAGNCRSWSVPVQIGRILSCLEVEIPDFPIQRCGVCFSKSACSVSSLLAHWLHTILILITSWFSRLILVGVRRFTPSPYVLPKGMIESSSFSCFFRVDLCR